MTKFVLNSLTVPYFNLAQNNKVVLFKYEAIQGVKDSRSPL